jgi:hypothetical protein
MVVVHISRISLLLAVTLAALVTFYAPGLFAGPITQTSWRPYLNPSLLVTLGMNKGEVLVKAGSPALEEVVSHGTDGHLNLTVWTYIKTGHNASVTVLTFQGNKLTKIEVSLSNQ